MSTTKSILSVIPARMGSSRFPGKPLALINGKPMISYVLDNCLASSLGNNVVVATPDYEIFEYISSTYSEQYAVLTSPLHERACDRAAEALLLLESRNGCTYDIVNMIQGDEPCISSNSIDLAINILVLDDSVIVVNLTSLIHNPHDLPNSNIIKVVFDKHLNILFLSRSPLPSNTRNQDVSCYKQVCCIPFRRDSLLLFNSLQEGVLERAESIDMLRLLENNMNIKACIIEELTHPVDIPEDIKIVEKILSV